MAVRVDGKLNTFGVCAVAPMLPSFSKLSLSSGAPPSTSVGAPVTREKRQKLIETRLELREKDETCAICLAPLADAAITEFQCSHSFHTECIREARRWSDHCPTCRVPLKEGVFDPLPHVSLPSGLTNQSRPTLKCTLAPSEWAVLRSFRVSRGGQQIRVAWFDYKLEEAGIETPLRRLFPDGDIPNFLSGFESDSETLFLRLLKLVPAFNSDRAVEVERTTLQHTDAPSTPNDSPPSVIHYAQWHEIRPLYEPPASMQAFAAFPSREDGEGSAKDMAKLAIDYHIFRDTRMKYEYSGQPRLVYHRNSTFEVTGIESLEMWHAEGYGVYLNDDLLSEEDDSESEDDD